MRRLALALLIFAALAGRMLFCGSASTAAVSPQELKPTSMVISWSSDGNPLVPVCNGRKLNCKKDLTVLDRTTGQEITVPIIASSYTISNPNDSYAVRVNGYNGRGVSISSEYEVVQVQ